MSARKRFLIAGAALLAITASAAAAQSPGGGQRFAGQARERLRTFIADYLDLTAEQKEQANVIFERARGQAEPVRAQLQSGREALRDAVKSGAPDAEFHRLAQAQGEAIGRMSAIYARSFAEFYRILTPGQKEKAEKLHARLGQRLSKRSGGRP